MWFASRVLLCAVVVCASTQLLPAAVIGYWRFEDTPGITADSSGNGRTLTGTGSPVSYTLSGSGAGSTFPSVIPQTEESNLKAAQFNGSNRYTTPDNAVWTNTTFSAEAFINGTDFDTNTSQKSIVGHWNSTGNNRSWLFSAGQAAGGSAPLSLLLSSLGTDTVTLTSTLTMLPNIDYYVAVTVDMADTTTAGITFYLKDLTNNGPLQTQGIAHTPTSLFNAATALSIGATSQPSSPFNGIIDEVRLSNTKLTQGELLISAIPEPSTYALALLSVVGIACWKRRRQ
jgi:hypothetical protein